MPSVVLLNQKGKKVSDLTLSEEVFDVKERQQAIFDTVMAELAAMRQGTQKAKTRSEVSGGGRKPWRQKGTGRARQGTIRAPQWRGGGVVFAPTPRKYNMKVNKKVVRLAMKCVLSEKVREESFIALDTLKLESFKTKDMVKVLEAVKATGKILVVTKEPNDQASLAGRNLPNVLVETVSHVSVYQLMSVNTLVITQDAISYYEEALR